MDIEREQGRRDLRKTKAHDDPRLSGKIALAHLRELPDSNDRLAVMEDEAEAT